MSCCDGYCSKCTAMQKIVLGAVVLANYWWGFVEWWLLVGAVLVLMGILKMVMPTCPCNKGMCEPEMPKGRKKK